MKTYPVRRYLVFLVGLTFISLAVGFITKADLGTSPITAIPYSLSLVFPSLSMGVYVAVFNLILIGFQAAFTDWNKADPSSKVDIAVEVVVCFLFGYLVDLSLALFEDLSPGSYPVQILCVLIGIVILAFGVYLQIVAGAVMLPGDGFVYSLTMKLRKDVGAVRICSDTSMVIIAAAIGLVFIGDLGGVREGSVMCCILTGFISRRYLGWFSKLTEFLIPGTDLSKVAKSRRNHAD